MTKIGRNDPCPCGSGKKYKKCHLDQPLPLDAANRRLAQVEAERRYLLERGIKIDYVQPIVFQGQKLWALGNRLYYGRPPGETFHEFIVAVLQQTLGRGWWERERQAAEKHYLMTCFEAYSDLRTKHAKPENRTADGRWAVVPDGPTQYLMSVAFDVASLVHKRNLPDSLLRRLMDKQQFQGARYELGVAAMFARLNYDIDFLDQIAPPNIKHCEFFATERESGETIAVEAKSRHRPGVLHMPGALEEERFFRGDVIRLIREAEEQSPHDRPYFIFIDRECSEICVTGLGFKSAPDLRRRPSSG